MQLHRRYPKPPITEAIIDLRACLPEGTTVNDLESVHRELELEYPKVRKRYAGTIQAMVGDDGATAAATQQHIGFLCMSRDERYVFQARLDGFTLSRLAPYECWDSFRDEAQRLWKLYETVAKPTRLSRVAVRYVNRLDLPLPVQELAEYLRTSPQVSPELPQDLAGYFMQIRIAQEDIKSFLLLNEAIVEPVRPGVASVVLDIDVFRVEELPQDQESLWQAIELLRNRKNEVFEACITDRARELFK